MGYSIPPSASWQLPHGDSQAPAINSVVADRALSVLAILPVGAQEESKQLLEWARAFPRAGDRYRVVTTHQWCVEELGAAGIAYSAMHWVPSAGSALTSPSVFTYAGAILRRLQAEPTDVVHCGSVRTSYAAALAIYLLAFCRPHFHEPALVTSLPANRTDARYTLDARALRYISDALVVRSPTEYEAVIRHGFPSERIGVIPADGERGEMLAGVRAVYLETCARLERRAGAQALAV